MTRYLFLRAEYRLNSEAARHTAPNVKPYGHAVSSADNRDKSSLVGAFCGAPLDAMNRTSLRTVKNAHGNKDRRNPPAKATGNVT